MKERDKDGRQSGRRGKGGGRCCSRGGDGLAMRHGRRSGGVRRPSSLGGRREGKDVGSTPEEDEHMAAQSCHCLELRVAAAKPHLGPEEWPPDMARSYMLRPEIHRRCELEGGGELHARAPEREGLRGPRALPRRRRPVHCLCSAEDDAAAEGGAEIGLPMWRQRSSLKELLT
jgi:hypothetical protein